MSATALPHAVGIIPDLWGRLDANSGETESASRGRICSRKTTVSMYVGRFKVGKEVAVLPASYAAAREVLEIAVVDYVSAAYLQLVDGRIFDPSTGRRMGSTDSCYIAPANDEHRAALASRAAAEGTETDSAKPSSLGGAQGD